MSDKRPPALAFIFVTILIDVIGLGIIIPVVPKLIQQLTGEGLSQAAVYSGWFRGPMALRTAEKTYAFWPGDFASMRVFDRAQDPLELRPMKLSAEQRAGVGEAMLSFVLAHVGST